MAKKKLKVALIGYKFMGKAHSQAYASVSRFFDLDLEPVMQVICGRDKVGLEKARDILGWQETETDWRKVVERKDIDLIDIATPNNMHKEIAIAALENKKHVICEKPLGMNPTETREMIKVAKKSGMINMVCHNYRRIPALVLAKKLIHQGSLGTIYHYRAQYLQDWIVDPEFPLVWRLKKEVSGSGTHGDINAHIIDLGRYLVGEMQSVLGLLNTFIKHRPLPLEECPPKKPRPTGEVTVDDSTHFFTRFRNGTTIGNLEASRFATGRKNGIRIEINGSEGSVYFNLEDLNRLEFYSRQDPGHLQGFKNILVTDTAHDYVRNWWPAGHIIGYEHSFTHTIFDLIQGIATGKNPHPDFEDGHRNQLILAAMEESSEKGCWVHIPNE